MAVPYPQHPTVRPRSPLEESALNSEKYYLKPNVLAEPLVGSWYAWPHLLPPATYGLNVLERHLSIMKSYVQAPMVHWAA
ncbi:MAG TPA: hypothetical protein VN851_04545, partial [Thermoanaerobaculia bacterium]|nr:hypothetical protein [Thermoanaerobaculia bacterium]